MQPALALRGDGIHHLDRSRCGKLLKVALPVGRSGVQVSEEGLPEDGLAAGPARGSTRCAGSPCPTVLLFPSVARRCYFPRRWGNRSIASCEEMEVENFIGCY